MSASSILYVSAFFVLFIISPLISVAAQIFVLLTAPYNSFYRIVIFVLSLAGVFGIINTTKIPISDMIAYIEHYENAGYFGFIDYIISADFEPVYSAYIFSLHKIFFGNTTLFIFGYTFFSYVMMFASILLITKNVNLNSKNTTQLLLIAAFFPPVFLLSFHLNRQFYAGILLLIFFSRYIINGRKNYLIYITSALFHSSSLIFLPFVVLSFNVKNVIKSIFLLLFFIFIIFSSLTFIGEFLMSLDSHYAERIGSRLLAENHNSTGGFGAIGRIFLIFFYFGAYLLWRDHRILGESVSKKGLLAFILAFTSISSVVFISSFFDNYSEIAGRLNLYLYFLYLPIALLLVKIYSFTRFLLIPLVIIIFVYFVISVEGNVFIYQSYLSRLLFFWF